MAEKKRRNLSVSLMLLLLALVSTGGAAFLYRGLLGLREELGALSAARSAADESARREAAKQAERDEQLRQSLAAFTGETSGRCAELLRNQQRLEARLAALPGPSAALSFPGPEPGPEPDPKPDPEEDYPLYRLQAGLGELFNREAYAECAAAACTLLELYPLDGEARFYRGASLLRLNPADSEALLGAKRDLQLALEKRPDDSRIFPLLREIALEEGARKDADEP